MSEVIPAPPHSSRIPVNPDRIVDMASRIADEFGLAALSAARLAGGLGIKPSSIYRHFASLETVKEAMAERGLRELIDLIGQATHDRAGRDALQALAYSARTYAQARSGLYLAAIQSGQHRPAAASLRADLRSLTATILATYGLDPASAFEEARCFLSALQGFILVELQGGVGTAFESDESYQRLIDMLDEGARASRNRLARADRRSPGPATHDLSRPRLASVI